MFFQNHPSSVFSRSFLGIYLLLSGGRGTGGIDPYSIAVAICGIHASTDISPSARMHHKRNFPPSHMQQYTMPLVISSITIGKNKRAITSCVLVLIPTRHNRAIGQTHS
jgi:hypothetical protein